MYLRALICAVILSIPAIARGQAPGTVYLVLGSDTAIWEGMDTSRYHCHYNIGLYTNQSRNAYKVMDAAWRNTMVDSYGQAMKFTWWMMAGQIFRYADNTDVPVPNTMTLHLMKQYHGAAIAQFGDELTLHYHTFAWTNYSGGAPAWVQAESFLECQDDFDFAVAQFLLEEGVYPVSFRSGWEWMSNDYQNHLNLLLPFSLEANWWKVWVPYHPSPTNYRVAGDGKGWNARCIYMANISQAQMNGMFAEAAAGADQVACIWAHLPEVDFLTNAANVHAKAHIAAGTYPTVNFRYCTAVEAMQRWLQTTGEAAPQLDVIEEIQGDWLTLKLNTDKPIFQAQPFVAYKDIYKQTAIVPCAATGSNSWSARVPCPRSGLCKVGIAVTDDSGHLTTRIIPYFDIPEPPPPPTNVEVVVDNPDATMAGSWIYATSSSDKYGPDYRYKTQGDGSACLQFTPSIPAAGDYQVCEWHPQGGNRTTNAPYIITYDGGQQTCYVNQKINGGVWNILGTFHFSGGTAGNVKITDGFPDTGQVVLADAIRFAQPVQMPPVILSPPLSQTINAGDAASFFVLPSGTTPMAFQWQFNGSNIAGATGTGYTVNPVLASSAGTYSIVISNTGGIANTQAVLTVAGLDLPPSIISQPQNQTVAAGAPVTFAVAASGPPPLSCQWRLNGSPLPSATTTSHVIAEALFADAGTYSVVVSNANGSVTSSNAVLTVIMPPTPTITAHPESQTLVAGTTPCLSVSATSLSPLTYQWRRDGAHLAGGTDSSLVLPLVQPSDAGSYDVVVANMSGAVTSATAVITIVVIPPPQLTLPGVTGDSQFQIGLSGEAGNAFVLAASTNLTDWLPIATTAFDDSSLLFADPESLTLPRRYYRARGMLTWLLSDFEGRSPGTAVMFHRPAYSGTTMGFIDTAAPNFAYVTNSFPTGHAGGRVVQAAWSFNASAGAWLRLTTSGGPIIPNPTVDFRQGLQFDVLADKPVYIAVGLRETSTTAAMGADGGNAGEPIEWLGGTTSNTSTPPKGRLVSAGQWTTLRFFFPHEPIRSYTGNGRLESTTGKGVFEQLAIVPANPGAGVYNLYLDNFQVIFIAP
ncbi:MAG TPA: immunoglobulin domain-containing protein [Candidatus Paceibacterota bacterium]|nr:immunoglobulin domain-containing protein [Candidatus Paceibacterota bacterium]